MAKSIRSKSKRSFRSKKREAGVYAATEAARLHRLNQRLASSAKKEVVHEPPEVDGAEGDSQVPGWCWFAIFGLLDAEDVGSETLGTFSHHPLPPSLQ
jgi:hypothetical protein